MPQIQARIREKLVKLYGQPAIDAQIDTALKQYHRETADASLFNLSERDVMLIAYGDHIQRDGEYPLQTLRQFLLQTAKPFINAIHILPFYPYTSDDGFSVVDYYAVNPDLGTWDDIANLRRDFRLMFDAVFNHISSQSAWFQAFLRSEAPYKDYFIVMPPNTDVSQVVRPRTLPLLTPFQTVEGTKYVWTTFSPDQVDLNLQNPQVLLELIKALLYYVEKGADFIRLDAIAFLWKEIGTPCIHLPQTHLIIQLMRDVLDAVAPGVSLITETNVPHEENISYFGDGTNEAQLVYNFALPPLILHTLRTGSAEILTQWASTLQRVGERTTFFNFTASHDGIGVRPATGILSSEDIEAMVQMTVDHGGQVSYRSLPNGGKSPYELNITYFDAITHPDITAQNPSIAVSRFIVSQAIALALMGMPGIYFHSLYGERNDREAVAQTGHNRAINRAKLRADAVLDDLKNPQSIRYQVYHHYRQLLHARMGQAAFHPLAPQVIHAVHPSLFVVERHNLAGDGTVLAVHNVSGRAISAGFAPLARSHSGWRDLLTDTYYPHLMSIELAPYQILWLTPVL